MGWVTIRGHRPIEAELGQMANDVRLIHGNGFHNSPGTIELDPVVKGMFCARFLSLVQKRLNATEPMRLAGGLLSC
jgi:hypothetical protein